MSEVPHPEQRTAAEADVPLRAEDLTGHLDRLEEAPLREHVAVLEDVHRRLTEALDEAEA